MMEYKINKENPDEFQLKELEYSTWVTGVKGQRDKAYIKVNKRNFGKDIRLSVPHNHCLLLNPSSATLRAVDADDFVTVIKPRTVQFDKITGVRAMECVRDFYRNERGA